MESVSLTLLTLGWMKIPKQELFQTENTMMKFNRMFTKTILIFRSEKEYSLERITSQYLFVLRPNEVELFQSLSSDVAYGSYITP